MSAPHGAGYWSAVCDCGMSRSYALTFCFYSQSLILDKLFVWIVKMKEENYQIYFIQNIVKI